MNEPSSSEKPGELVSAAIDSDGELQAIRAVLGALVPLKRDGRTRVLDYVLKRLGMSGEPMPSGMAFDFLTAPFTYVRLLGDRKGIEKITKTWDKVIVNRSKELHGWVDVCQQTVKRGVSTYLYINNHFSGHAPKTVADFLKLWDAK